MQQKHVMMLIGAIVVVGIIAVVMMKKKPKRKETWFSRDLNYGKANSELWNAVTKEAQKAIANDTEDILKEYPYLGYGDYTGMMCRGPNNQGCSTYMNLDK